VEFMFAGFFVFFIANIALVIWALVDAIRVPDDSMYRAGNKLIWILVILLAGFVGAIRVFLRRRAGERRRLDDGCFMAGSASARLDRLTEWFG